MSDYLELKNYLDEKDFKNIQENMMSQSFPWFYSEKQTDKCAENDPLIKGSEKEEYTDDKESFFAHPIYMYGIPQTSCFELIQPLIKKINPISVVSIKANLNINKGRVCKSGWHTDYHGNSYLNHKTAIFYINNNNGYTELKNNVIIKSEQNKLVVFKANTLHRACSQTDVDTRIVININYF